MGKIVFFGRACKTVLVVLIKAGSISVFLI